MFKKIKQIIEQRRESRELEAKLDAKLIDPTFLDRATEAR